MSEELSAEQFERALRRSGLGVMGVGRHQPLDSGPHERTASGRAWTDFPCCPNAYALDPA